MNAGKFAEKVKESNLVVADEDTDLEFTVYRGFAWSNDPETGLFESEKEIDEYIDSINV